MPDRQEQSSTGARSWHPRNTLLRAKHRSPPSLVLFVGRLLQELQRLEPFDRAMTLAAQAFTSIFPLVITAVSVLDRQEAGQLGDRFAESLALPPSSRSALDDALPAGNQQFATFGALSLLLVLLSATSFSRALTRMYAKAWSVRPPGWTGGWRWIAAIVGITICTMLLQAVNRAGQGSEAGVAGALLLTLVLNSVLWTWVPWVLLARRISWPLLTPGGVIMGMATVALFFVSRLYLPRALASAARKYGELGVAFSFIGWLFAVAFVLIVATVLGAGLAREPGPIARLLARERGARSSAGS